MLKKLFYIIFIDFIFVVTTTQDIFSKFHQSDYKLDYHHADLTWYDRNYYKQYVLRTYKFNRTIAVTNYTFEYKIRPGYDLMTFYQVYKQYSNEYRHFPIRFQIGVCSIAEKNLSGLGRIIEAFNITCPLEKARTFQDVVYHFRYYPDISLLPPFIPTGEYMIEIKTQHLQKDISVVQAFARIYRPIVIKD